MKIYTPDGRVIRRVLGFCDHSFKVIKEEGEEEISLVADAIGSNESYWSETEERYLDLKDSRS